MKKESLVTKGDLERVSSVVPPFIQNQEFIVDESNGNWMLKESGQKWYKEEEGKVSSGEFWKWWWNFDRENWLQGSWGQKAKTNAIWNGPQTVPSTLIIGTLLYPTSTPTTLIPITKYDRQHRNGVATLCGIWGSWYRHWRQLNIANNLH